MEIILLLLSNAPSYGFYPVTMNGMHHVPKQLFRSASATPFTIVKALSSYSPPSHRIEIRFLKYAIVPAVPLCQHIN